MNSIKNFMVSLGITILVMFAMFILMHVINLLPEPWDKGAIIFCLILFVVHVGRDACS